MNKIVEDGKVAILITNRHGAQWYTNHNVSGLLFDPYVVAKVLEMNESDLPLPIAMDIEEYCDRAYGNRTYYGDAMYLTVEWILERSKFSIIFDEGFEQLTIPYDEVFIA